MALRQNKDGSYDIVPEPDPVVELGVIVIAIHAIIAAVAIGVQQLGDESLKKQFFESSKPVPQVQQEQKVQTPQNVSAQTSNALKIG